MTANTASIPTDANGRPVLALLNDATGQVIPVHVGSTVTGADGQTYALLDVHATVTATNPSVGADGSAAPTSSTQIGASDGTNLQPLQVDGSKNLKVVQQGNVTEVNSAAIKSDLDTVVTNTNKIPASPAQEGGNLASVATNTSNTATVAGGTGDAAVTGDTAGTLSAKLRGLTKILADIWDSVNHRIKVDGSGVTQPISQPTSSTGTLTSVAAATSSTTLLAANSNRKGVYVYNDSTAILYIALNASASTTSYTTQVGANDFYEVPTSPVYTGAISAVWASAVGNARITEMS